MSQSRYDLKDIELPLLEGATLTIVDRLLSLGLTRPLLLPGLQKNAGIVAFRRATRNASTVRDPAEYRPRSGTQSEEAKLAHLNTLNAGLTASYRDGSSSPEAVAKRVLNFLEQENPKWKHFVEWDARDVLDQAAQSATRWATGKPLGPLDGVPVAVKDEIDQRGLPTHVGTSFLGTTPATLDATAVQRLRDAGALLVGKTVMHEIGIGVSGQNIHWGTARNPADPRFHTGGSSSGSAATVGHGLCPIALGADGGGSIRIPSGFCGVVGLKPSFGRVSEYGAAPLCWSVAHLGPIARDVPSASLAYLTIAGPDPKDAQTNLQPPVVAPDLEKASLEGKIIGVDSAWFDHADPEVVKICREKLALLVARGARVKELALHDLEAYRVAHVIIIISEMAQAMAPYWKQNRAEFSAEVRMNLTIARSLGSLDYQSAQQARNEAQQQFSRVLDEVDFIATPASAVLPPEIRPSADRRGNWDVTTLTKIMRYATIPNLTGLPALVFPAGKSASGLPVGFQLMGRAWDEAGLLEAAWAGR